MERSLPTTSLLDYTLSSDYTWSMKRLVILLALSGALSCSREAPRPPVPSGVSENLYDYVPQCFKTPPATPVSRIADTDYCD